jgi:hypothetical protein
MGYVAVGNLEHGAVHGGWSSPAAGVAHGAQAADPAATAGSADLDAAPELQQSTPPAAVSWEEWDTPENREPMVPAYVPDIPADLTENPGFREALRMHTRDSARQCRCGCRVDGDTWGERMVRSAIHVLRSDTAAVAFVPWPDEAPPDATEAGIEAYDARHPVPAALAGGAA